jgi:hypothetical protein
MNDNPSRLNSISLADLPLELASRIQSELQAGETVVWMGQPLLDMYIKASGCLLAFGILSTGLIAMLATVGFFLLRSAGTILLILSGLAFLVSGLSLLGTPIWMKKRAKGTYYLLTNLRGITWEPTIFGRAKISIFAPDELAKLTCEEKPDGSGSLVFRADVVMDNDGYTTLRRGFLNIDNVRVVEGLIRRTLLSPSANQKAE